MPAQLPLVADRVSSGAHAIVAGKAWLRGGEEAVERKRPARQPMVTAHFTQDREIYGEGDNADVIFKVVSGVVRTCKFLSDGRRQIEEFHVSGDLFGFEVGAERTLCAEAVSDCTLVAYRRRALEGLPVDDEGLAPQLLSHAMRNLARARDHLLLLGRKSAVEKVAAFIVEWAQRGSGGAMVTLPMTRQDIADYLGLTIETVSRTLSQLEREAVIELPTAREIRLANPAALHRLNS